MAKIGQLPQDENDKTIPLMRLKPGGTQKIAATSGGSVRNATAIAEGIRVVSLFATEDMYIKFGGAAVTASSEDTIFPKGAWYDFAIDGAEGTTQYTHVAALCVSASTGILQVAERF